MKSIRSTEDQRLESPGSLFDVGFHVISTLFASIVAIVLAAMTVVLITGSAPVFSRFGLVGFIVGVNWNPVLGKEVYGALPYILGTTVTSAVAVAIGVPISLGVAIFLSEMSPWSIRGPVSQLIELLAAVPSVIYGLWGLFVFRFWVRDLIETPLSKSLGNISVFSGTPSAVGDILTAGLLLAIMIIPTVSAVSREVMLAVPNSQREAAYSLGATRWEAVRMGVLSYSRSGIFGAAILGLGRAVGETVAVTMVIGNATGPAAVPTSLFQTGATLSSIIAFFNQADPASLNPAALIGLGLVLFMFALLINVFAQLLVWRVLKIKRGAVE